MYCTQCGSEIKDAAKFCTACGAPVDGAISVDGDGTEATKAAEWVAETTAETTAGSGSPSFAAEPAEPAADSQPVTFKAVMDTAKQKSKRRIPLVVLLALALALTSGVAYAAYRVYTDVIVPAMQAQQEQQGQGADAPAQGEPAAEEPVTAEVTGNPQSIFQVAEILAMDPAQMSDYFESQGFARTDTDDDAAGLYSYPGADPYTAWLTDPGDFAPFAADAYAAYFDKNYFETNEAASTSATRSYGPALVVGDAAVDVWHCSTEYADASSLQAGKVPQSVMLVNLPVADLGEDDVAAFCEACNLGMPAAHFSYAMDEDVASANTVYVGYAEADDGQRYVWYLSLREYTSDDSSNTSTAYHTATLGCVRYEVACDLLVDGSTSIKLYTADEWAAADADVQALMIAQSLVQDKSMGNGSMRTNVVTGEKEMAFSVAGSDEYEWRFSAYTIEPGQTSDTVTLVPTDPDLESVETYDSPNLR